MLKPGLLLVAVMVVAGSGDAAAAGDSAKPPRWTHRKIEIEQYFQMADTREAGRLLLVEAQLAQLELDYEPEVHMPEILLQSGKMIPPRGDRSFFNRKASAPLGVKGALTLLKFSRPPTIREISEMLEHGIRLYRGIPYDSYVANVPDSSMNYAATLEALEWAGEYVPSYKYDASVEGKENILIYSLPGDRPECREDLARLGVTIEAVSRVTLITYHYEYYVAKAPHGAVPLIAALWWVQMIEPAPMGIEGAH